MRFKTALALAVASFTACWEDIPAGDYTSVYFWSDVMWNKYEEGRMAPVTEAGPGRLETPRTVLLITGVSIRAGWFDRIVERLERDGFIPVVYEPPALLSGNLFQASIALEAVVEQVQEDSGQDKIDILAECTGGLIARYYLQSMRGHERVRSMVTFVSPQSGVGKAPLAADIAGWPALYDLSPGSAFLNAVNDAPLPDGVPITSIYTCTDEYIQPWQSSVIPGATNIGLACEGGFVGHFQTFYDPAVYLLMHGALVKPTPAEEAAANEPDPIDVEDPTDVEDPADVEDPTDVPPDAEDPSDEDPIGTPDDMADPTQLPVTPTTPDAPMHIDGDQQVEPEAGLGCASAPSSMAALGLALVALALTRRRLRADDARR